MNSETALLGPGGITFLGFYILSLILIGWFGKKAADIIMKARESWFN